MSSAVIRQVAVIGEGVCSSRTAAAAERVGRAIATAGAVLFTGGRGGVMEAASRGAAKAGGTVVGVLPGSTAAAPTAGCRSPWSPAWIRRAT